MDVILFLSMFLLFIMSIVLSKFNLTHPAVLFSGVWCVSSFGCCFSYELTHEILELPTVLFLVLFNMLFIFITFLFTNLNRKKQPKFNYEKIKNKKIKFRNSFLVLGVLFYIFASIYLLKDLMRMANAVGKVTSIFEVFRLARYADTVESISYSFLSTYLMRFNLAVGIVSTYYATKYFFMKKKKIFRKFFIFSIISLGFTFFSAARNQAIILISSYLFTSLFNFYYYSSKSNKALFKKALGGLFLAGVVFIVIFIVIGNVFLKRMKDGTLTGIVNSLIEYTSGPILAFNYYLKNMGEYTSPYFGAYTLNTLNNFLIHIGVIENPISILAPFMNNGYWQLNVYTMYFRYLVDFGGLGTVLLVIIVAAFYGIFYKISLSSKNKDLMIPIYSLFMYGLIMSFFEEKIITFLNWYIIIIIMIGILKFVVTKFAIKTTTIKQSTIPVLSHSQTVSYIR